MMIAILSINLDDSGGNSLTSSLGNGINCFSAYFSKCLVAFQTDLNAVGFEVMDLIEIAERFLAIGENS